MILSRRHLMRSALLTVLCEYNDSCPGALPEKEDRIPLSYMCRGLGVRYLSLYLRTVRCMYGYYPPPAATSARSSPDRPAIFEPCTCLRRRHKKPQSWFGRLHGCAAVPPPSAGPTGWAAGGGRRAVARGGRRRCCNGPCPRTNLAERCSPRRVAPSRPLLPHRRRVGWGGTARVERCPAVRPVPCPALFRPALPALLCPALPCPALPCPVLPSPALSCPFLPCSALP